MEIFTNPGYLAAAGALVSVPIIIHLINRMRFKRIRWAAMEFLLKAMKRTRRRLIIEQLLLLALRCFLIFLVGLLVMRFVGFSWAGFGAKPSLHVVLLDDTLSMRNHWKDGDITRDAFQTAKMDVLFDKIVKGIGQAGSSDRLLILQMSHLGAAHPDFQPKALSNLNDQGVQNNVKKQLEALPCSYLHVDPMTALKKAQEIIAEESLKSRITLHILSDFRQKEWGLPEGETLYKTLLTMTQAAKDMKVRLIDTVSPYRVAGQGGAPLSHDNVGIVDLRAGTRVAGKDMPVQFTVVLANYSANPAEVNVVVHDDAKGQEMLQVDFNPPMPIKVPAGSTNTTATFEVRFSPQIKAGQSHYELISARLESAQRGKLENDGLATDNVRHASVEIRDRVPILVIDGNGAKGREENGDSFFLKTALDSVPGASYEIFYGDVLGGGLPTKVLERGDLSKYPTIFLLNVRELNDKQLANLENFVKDGGGVGFFLGPNVSGNYYNKKLYQGGKGLFPVPLKEQFYPPAADEALKPEFTGNEQLLLRDKNFATMDTYPIFGAVFKEKEQRERLKDLPVRRYFQVQRSDWRPEPGKVMELATLPNELPAKVFQRAALELVEGPMIEKLLQAEEYQKYQKGFDKHRREVRRVVEHTSEAKGFQLAKALENFLNDKGSKITDTPNMTEFWSTGDPKIASLRDSVLRLQEQVYYGDPFVVAGGFGRGKVVVVTTTAGKEWNDFGGGSDASLIYQPFVWEMQNWLSSTGSEGNLNVGTPMQVTVDLDQYRQKGGAIKVRRTFIKPEDNKPAKSGLIGEQFLPEGKGPVTLSFDKTFEPGLYATSIFQEGAADALAVYASTYNVDTMREGPLQRVNRDNIDRELVLAAPPGTFLFAGPGIDSGEVITRRSDLSESPWFFLIFLAVLIAEQALAVHLSFHLKGNEQELRTPRVPGLPGEQKAA